MSLIDRSADVGCGRAEGVTETIGMLHSVLPSPQRNEIVRVIAC